VFGSAAGAPPQATASTMIILSRVTSFATTVLPPDACNSSDFDQSIWGMEEVTKYTIFFLLNPLVFYGDPSLMQRPYNPVCHRDESHADVEYL
jgi:hypothetical protein